jgi:predicted ABC-type ATPase
MQPTLSVVAGPNGSGKSTLTASIWFEGNANLIDPDTLARTIDPLHPADAAIQRRASPSFGAERYSRGA